MSLNPGSKLGPYEILSPLGAGGMGEVYKAKDTRLDRTVAIKVLPSHLSDNARLKERFEREARAVSSLNHPNICTLHDIGSENGIDFMVMEHIEGQTLADRLKKGALPLDQALQHGIEIADALDKAHRQGVVHRDLKPGNIMLAKSGAKLLDFGLAKLAGPEAGAVESALPTQQRSLTAEGSILGTLQYMAPEQLEGKEADARTDIFAFGAVVYEMVTGKKAFEGKSQASLIHAIMGVDPQPMEELEPITPKSLNRLVEVCLSKDPEDRWQSVRDLGRELRWLDDPDGPTVKTASSSPRMSVLVVVAILAVLTTGLAVIGLWPNPSSSTQIARFSIDVEADHFLPSHLGTIPLAIDPNGSRISYVVSDGGSSRLYVRDLDDFESHPIPGTEGATNPFFSPDSEWLGFFADRQLKRVSMSGGAPQIVSAAPLSTDLIGASWGANGKIVFNEGVDRGISEISDERGVPQPLIRVAPDDWQHLWPQILPNARAVLFNRDGANGRQLAVFSLETESWSDLVPATGPGRYVPTGHIVYSNQGDLWAMRFDLMQLRQTGEPFVVEEALFVDPFGAEDVAPFSISPTGMLAFLTPVDEAGAVWIDRGTGDIAGEVSLDIPSGPYPRFSPDGNALSIFAEGRTWIYDLSTGLGTPLTAPGANIVTAWTPDGTRLAFASNRTGSMSLFWGSMSRPDASELLLERPNRQYPASWLDDETLVFIEVHPETGGDILTLRLVDGTSTVEPFLATADEEQSPRLSPDGRWLAYVSNKSGEYNVYVRRFPEADMEQAISTAGGDEPVWSADGRELFYRQGTQMMAVSVESEETFNVLSRQTLFDGNFDTMPCCAAAYDVSPDGQYFLMVPRSQATQIKVVLNWFEKLERLDSTSN